MGLILKQIILITIIIVKVKVKAKAKIKGKKIVLDMVVLLIKVIGVRINMGVIHLIVGLVLG